MFTNPEAIQTEAVQLIAADGSSTLAASASALRISQDGGAAWQDVRIPQVSADALITALAYVPSAEGRRIVCGVKGGVVISADAGRSWRSIPLGAPPPVITDLRYQPNDKVLLAATLEDGVWCSADAGETWQQWNFGLLDWRVLALATTQDGMWLAGAESGVYISRTAGRSWQRTEFPCAAGPVLSVAAGAAGTLFAGTEQHGLLQSKDGGQTWHTLPLPADNAPVNALIVGEAGRMLALQGTQLIASTDAGHTWAAPQQVAEAGAVTCVSAPTGLAQGAALLVGYQSGRVAHITIGASL